MTPTKRPPAVHRRALLGAGAAVLDLYTEAGVLARHIDVRTFFDPIFNDALGA